MREGLYFPCSRKMIVSRRTPTRSASSSWVQPRSVRNFRTSTLIGVSFSLIDAIEDDVEEDEEGCRIEKHASQSKEDGISFPPDAEREANGCGNKTVAGDGMESGAPGKAVVALIRLYPFHFFPQGEEKRPSGKHGNNRQLPCSGLHRPGDDGTQRDDDSDPNDEVGFLGHIVMLEKYNIMSSLPPSNYRLDLFPNRGSRIFPSIHRIEALLQLEHGFPICLVLEDGIDRLLYGKSGPF